MSRHHESRPSRRAFVTAALYVPPAILTLHATPALAAYGSDVPVTGRPVHLVDRLRDLFRGWLE